MGRSLPVIPELSEGCQAAEKAKGGICGQSGGLAVRRDGELVAFDARFDGNDSFFGNAANWAVSLETQGQRLQDMRCLDGMGG